MPTIHNPSTGGTTTVSERTVGFWLAHGWQLDKPVDELDELDERGASDIVAQRLREQDGIPDEVEEAPVDPPEAPADEPPADTHKRSTSSITSRNNRSSK